MKPSGRIEPPAWMGDPPSRRLLGALAGGGIAARFVGGCVRNAVLGRSVDDIDLAIDKPPTIVMRALEAAKIRAIPTGLKHGTVTAIVEGRTYELTTLRRDVETDGRRAVVAFTDDWRADAARRDFTINALSADPLSGEVYDYFNGLADLEARRVRFIGDPLQRIAEDHLRILRFFRFHARFGADAPDAEGVEACAARANDLMALSRERIADELLKLLALPDPTATVRLMIERGIFRPVLPEIDSADRLDALVAAEQAAGIAPAAIRRLAALLPVDPQVAAAVGARLRLSNKLAGRLVAAAGTALDAPTPLAYRIGATEAIDRILLHDRPGPEVKQLEDWRRPHLPVSGGDLIAMGLTAGPVVAKTMQALEEEWIAAGFPADKNAVRAMARRLVDQLLRSSQ